MVGPLFAPMAFLFALVSPAGATAVSPASPASPTFCGAVLAHIIPLNPDARGAAITYVLSLMPSRGEAGYVSGTLSLYDEADRWDVAFRDIVAAQDADQVHPASPIVVRFSQPVHIDAAHLASVVGPPAGTCIPVSAHVETKPAVPDAFTPRLRVAAATKIPTDAGVPTPDPAPQCAVRNAPPELVRAAVPVTSDFMRSAGTTGLSLIRVTLADDGTLLDAFVDKPAGAPGADESALQAAKASIYVPSFSGCRNVGGIYRFAVEFNGQ